MSSAIGQKFFKTATEPLATTFDGTTQGLRLFLYFVAQRAELQNWSKIITPSLTQMGLIVTSSRTTDS